MPAPLPWFRLWNEIKWDRKIRRLDPADRWLYIACLSLASESPERGRLLLNSSGEPEVLTHADIADSAAMPVKDVSDGLIQLCSAGLLEPRDDHEYALPVDATGRVPTLYVVPRWDERQPSSDSSTERVRRHRARQREAQGDPPTGNGDETLHARSGSGAVTAPENREQITEKNPPVVPPARGKRPLPTDWEPNDTHQRLATDHDRDLQREAQAFRDYCQAHDRRYKDHDAAFRQWLRNDQYRAPPNGQQPRLTAAEQKRARTLQAIQTATGGTQ